MDNEENNKKYTEEELMYLVAKMRNSGYFVWEIAQRLGISEAKVVSFTENIEGD